MRHSALVELVRDTRRGLGILQRKVQKAADLVRDVKQVSIDQTTDRWRESVRRRIFDSSITAKLGTGSSGMACTSSTPS